MSAFSRVLGLFILAALLTLTVMPTFGQDNPWTSGVLNPPWYRGNLPPGHDH
jgi:hypothetical protein